MLDLYCWVTLLCELCLGDSTLANSVSTAKDSIKQLEKSIEKAKNQILKLAADAKADCTEIFNCEDLLQNLMMRLQLERRRVLSACVDLTTEKILTMTEEVRSETTKMGVEGLLNFQGLLTAMQKSSGSNISPPKDFSSATKSGAGGIEVQPEGTQTSDQHQLGAFRLTHEVRHVALFCKKVLKAMHTQLPAELPEVDLVAFGHLKAACVQYLRLIVASVLENSADRIKRQGTDESQTATKLMKTT